MTAEKSRRFALTGHDPDGRNRTVILWRELDLVDGTVVRRVVLTLDATMTTATVLTLPEAREWRRPSWRRPGERPHRTVGAFWVVSPQTCFTVYLLPDPVFARQAPAGRWFEPGSRRGSQWPAGPKSAHS
jgi:hypothetical protein